MTVVSVVKTSLFLTLSNICSCFVNTSIPVTAFPELNHTCSFRKSFPAITFPGVGVDTSYNTGGESVIVYNPALFVTLNCTIYGVSS